MVLIHWDHLMYLAKLTLQTHGAQRTQVKHSTNQGNTNQTKWGLSGQIVRETKDRTSTQARDNPKWSHPS